MIFRLNGPWIQILWGPFSYFPSFISPSLSPSLPPFLPSFLSFFFLSLKNSFNRASLVAQWLRVHLPMQGTWVRALVREDPTCHGATKPAIHNYWARVPQLLKPAHLEPVLGNKRSHRNGKPAHHNEEYPLLAATRESPRAATKTQRSHE